MWVGEKSLKNSLQFVLEKLEDCEEKEKALGYLNSTEVENKSFNENQYYTSLFE